MYSRNDTLIIDTHRQISLATNIKNYQLAPIRRVSGIALPSYGLGRSGMLGLCPDPGRLKKHNEQHTHCVMRLIMGKNIKFRNSRKSIFKREVVQWQGKIIAKGKRSSWTSPQKKSLEISQITQRNGKMKQNIENWSKLQIEQRQQEMLANDTGRERRWQC